MRVISKYVLVGPGVLQEALYFNYFYFFHILTLRGIFRVYQKAGGVGQDNAVPLIK
jgi:hypothetical protein